jgi:5-methylcytosine-specific restriction endonuclease McrA
VDSKFKSFIISLLRRGTYRWKPRNECLKAAKVAYGKYQCNICKQIFRKKDITLDHIEPVVPVTGFTTFDDYIIRMYPQKEGFQVICKVEHSIKTKRENLERKENRKKKKASKGIK